MARKIFTVFAVLMFILTLSSCQKGVSQEEYDGLKAQLDTSNSELNSYKESAEQSENDLSDLKSKAASAKQYADILSAIFEMSGPSSTDADAMQAVVTITTMVNETGNQELIDEWSKVMNAGNDTAQSNQAMNNVLQIVLKGIVDNMTDL